MSEPILEIVEVTKSFGRTITADRLSLTVERGEFFTFLGPSGSGKSTILRMVAGLERSDTGHILIQGKDVSDVPPWHRNLGMVFQNYAVFPHMTVAQNVGYGLKVRNWPKAERASRVAEMLRLVGLAGMENKNVTLLSGGEQQRVALARALAPQPAMLLLDEPLSALDERIRREMQTELKHIHTRTGTTFLYVTHDQEEALTMSDRIAVLNRGICVQCDEPERIYRRPRTRFVATFFRGCNVVEARLIDAATDGRMRVAFGGGTIEVQPKTDRPERGRDLALAIRAENLHLGERAAQGQVRLPAHLLETVYRGTNVDHLLELEDGQKLIATSTRREVAETALPVSVVVAFDPADLIVLEEEPTATQPPPAAVAPARAAAE